MQSGDFKYQGIPGKELLKSPVSKILFTATVDFKVNLQLDLIMMLQLIKQNKTKKYEKLFNWNGVITFLLNLKSVCERRHSGARS